MAPSATPQNGLENGFSNLTVISPLRKPNPIPVIVTKTSNGSRHEERSSISTTTTAKKTSTRYEERSTALKETVITTKTKFISEFSHFSEHSLDVTTIEGFLDVIERERLTHMPHKGSRWDRVLKSAEFFALQVSAFDTALSSFTSESHTAAKLIWAACTVLLDLGPGNAQALEKTFTAFYKLGLSLSFLLRRSTLLGVNESLRKESAQSLSFVLILVSDVSIYYHKRVTDASTASVSLDFNQVFARQIESFQRVRNHIIDELWNYQLGNDLSGEIRIIRKWLGSTEQTLKIIQQSRQSVVEHREEYTCEWFQRHLLDFSRSNDDILPIQGHAASGKSYLCGWIVERLQRPLGRKTHDTLSYSAQGDVPSLVTPIAIAKNLCLQLLEKNVGDKKLFKKLVDVHKLSLESGDSGAIEAALWGALDIGLDTFNQASDNLMIVIDGADEINSVQQGKLCSLASKHKKVQLIMLARTFHKKPANKVLEITFDHIHKDLGFVAEHALKGYQFYEEQTEFEKENVVESLVHGAKGSYLWALLNIFYLKTEKSKGSFMKALQEMPKTLDQIISKAIGLIDFNKNGVKLLLSWMLVAQRPFSLTEVRSLLQIDLQKKALAEISLVAVNNIIRDCYPLIVLRDGFVWFRHSEIRSALMKLQMDKKKVLPWTEAQTDLTMRLLAYCKISLTEAHEPTFDRPGLRELTTVFTSRPLLEYAIRNWIIHFQGSSLHKATGKYEFSDEFKSMFPSSSEMAVLEWVFWEREAPLSQSFVFHNLALKIRQEIFGDTSLALLQNLIICGTISKPVEATNYFYRASIVAQSVLHKYSMIAITCTTKFLTYTETFTITMRTETVTRREEMLKFIITACKHQYGKTSDLVIQYSKTLAQLYICIKEEQKAEIIWRELKDIIVIRYGKGSEEETEVSKELMIVLKQEKKEEDIVAYEKSIFATCSHLDFWDIRRIKVTLELALSYEARGELFMAEELYIIQWRRLIEHSHKPDHHDFDIHILILDAALEYVRFLRRCGRHEEASSILICIWTEYEEYDFESELIFLRLKIVGEIMRAVTLLHIAVSVFRKCFAWFKSHGYEEHTQECETLISTTVQEIITTTTTTTTTETVETTIREIFESTMTRTTVTSESISVFSSLISFYMKLEKWTEAIEVTKRSLTLVWKAIITGRGTIALPSQFDSEALELAISLAICHHKSHQYHEAEEFYRKIYRACRVSCHVEDVRLVRSYGCLISFYEEHRHWHKLISMHREMLAEYRKLGASHSMTIKTLYILGSLCYEHGSGALEYYEEIIRVLNGSSHVCHHDAFQAMIFLSRAYYEEGHWKQLRGICEILWETFIHHHHEYKYESDFIEVLYFRYVYVLEHHFHCEYEISRRISIEYRDTCIKYFGAFSVITIKAMMELAQICMRSEKHTEEAISIYEKIIKETTTTTTATMTTTTTTVSKETITTIKERLSKAYIKVCGHGSTTTTTIERGIKILLERYESLRITCGYAHIQTLEVLREIIILYKRLNTKESHSSIISILQETLVLIITKEQRSRTLYDASIIIGELYGSCGHSKLGLEIIHELRRQIITHKSSSSNKFGFKIDITISKSSYVFLVALERVLRGSGTVSYSEIMTDILTETTLYEHYTHYVEVKAETTLILTYGARLRHFLFNRHRFEEVSVIQKDTFEIFLKKWGSSIKTHKDFTFLFYVSLIEELGMDSSEGHIGHAACSAGAKETLILLQKGEFQKAFEVASCTFQFSQSQGAYAHLHNIGYGVKLSAYMAGRWDSKPAEKSIEPELNEKMLELSRAIIRVVFQTCKDAKIDFVRLNSKELNELVCLLGNQKNYADLEALLFTLWQSREVQKTWKPIMIISIGARLVQARYLAGNKLAAIQLCEDICYNLRRVWGSLDPKALEMFELLSQLYTSAGHYREAMGVHEDILRLVVEGDDGDDRTHDEMDSERARQHVRLLKASFLRLRGWDKSPAVYKELVNELKGIEEYKSDPEWKKIASADKWDLKDKAGDLGVFLEPSDWELVNKQKSGAGVVVCGYGGMNGKYEERPRMRLKRASSNWGLGVIHRLLLGDHEEDVNGNGVGRSKELLI